jgi:ABC-type Na+ efflux pump permease subunit
MLPIAERELRVASRQPKTYRTRAVTALVMLLCATMIMWLMETWGGAFLSGPEVFRGLSTAVLLYYVFVGTTRTADCLSEEKREGTLGLLFLTDLKGHDVVLGKLLATSLHAFYGFLTTLPLFAIAFTLGGVKLGEFWRIMLNMAATLLLSLSVGIFVSSLSRNHRRALSATTSILVVLMFVLPGAAELLRRKGYLLDLAVLLQFLSPLNTHSMAFESASALRNNFFWWSLLTTCFLTAGLLALASFILPRAWQDRPSDHENKFGKGWRGVWQQIKLGPKAARTKLRRQRLDRNPFFWLASRERFRNLPLWLFIILVAGSIEAIWLRYSESDRQFAIGISFAGALALVFSFLTTFASAASQRLAEDRQNGTLELLLSTPLSVKAIVRGQWLALIKQFAWPAIAILVIDTIVYGLGKSAFGLTAEQVYWSWTSLLIVILGLAHVMSLGWTSIWMALRVKQATHASAAAFWRIMLLPWPMIWVILTSFYWARSSSYLETFLPYLVPVTIVSVLMLNSLFWSIWCSVKLHKEFRTAATDRFQPAKPHLSWWKVFVRLGISARTKIASSPMGSPDVTMS